MFGDWVNCITDGTPYRFGRLSSNPECHYTIDEKLNFNYDIEPIPLTEEILKKNGFELHEFNGVMCYERPEFVIHHSMRDCVGRNNFTYNHVHELQHALRLCGLNDLADNLKV